MSATPQDVTLLLVEDDDVDVMTIQRGLKMRRIANPVVRVRDGREALDLLHSEQAPWPMIVLLDLNMPRLSGLEFLDAIRADPKLAHLTVFVLTTSRDEKDLLKAYQKQVAGYFLKEAAGDEFIDLVDLLNGYWKIVCLPV